MAQDNQLPEGTDTIIDGALETGNPTAEDTGSDALIVDTMTGSTDETAALSGAAAGTSGTSSGGGSWAEKVRGGREQFAGQATDKVHGLVGQGLERSSEALGNVSRMIGDTAAGIEERLGAEYGDYARRAAQAIEDAANNLASKQPEDLIEDTRNFVRKSPGVALAGAAVIGFALTRLIKNGLSSANDDDRVDGAPPRTTSAD
jgi:ElaB/YqjD/DUF883 family membrane-anchored ribosome-binding protein